MKSTKDTVIIGAGQAGLALSYFLARQGRDHVVLEQSDGPGEAWRNHRWDSFVLNTPAWQSALPGAPHEGNPDRFLSRNEIVSYLDSYARRFRLPIRTRARVTRVTRDTRSANYVVVLSDGGTIATRNVVVATGLYQAPKIPAFAANFPADLLQVHSDAYRNPGQLKPGAVLVVGSAQSGAQIAEELNEAGRKVYLAVGRAGRTPRRYRGRDANWWFDKMGQYERTARDLPSAKAKFAGKPHVSGTRGGHTLNLHQFARDGVALLGHLEGVRDGNIDLAPDLHENLRAADKAEADALAAIDAYVAKTGLVAPEETLPVLRDGFDRKIITLLNLREARITNVIWATSYDFDFSLVALPVFDGDGFPIQQRGAAEFPGLYFLGLPWLHNAKSGLIYGVEDDARYIAERIAERAGSNAVGLAAA